MNWDQIEGQWRQLTGRVKSTWGKAIDDDMQNVGGKRKILLGKVQARYGVLKDDAEKRIDGWIAKVLSSEETNGSSEKKADKTS
jgi:uncharacterized protein YjbJ (UPF0337 family)